MQLPVTLRPQPSRRLAAALVAAHSAAAGGIAATALPLSFKLAIVVALATSLLFHLWRCVLRSPISALTLRADGKIDVERSDGSCVDSQPLSQTTVLPWLCVLHLKAAGRTSVVVLPPDALAAEGYRQLCLWLRWKPG